MRSPSVLSAALQRGQSSAGSSTGPMSVLLGARDKAVNRETEVFLPLELTSGKDLVSLI